MPGLGKLQMFLEKPLTETQTENLRRWFFITWELLIVITTLISLTYLWRHPNLWTTLPILAVSGFVVYRLYRRAPRRCPHCSDKTELDEHGHEVFKKNRNPVKVLLGGWFARRHYWREPINYSALPGVDESFLKKVEEKLRTEDPARFNRRCFFHFTCVTCGFDYQVKPPEYRSFRNRPRVFLNW